MKNFLLSLGLVASAAAPAMGAQTELLDRGVVAVKTENSVFVSWRSLPSDDSHTTFDVYRDGVKVNDAPLAAGTNFTDPAGTTGSKYVIKALLNDEVVETSKECGVEPDVFRRLHLSRPAEGTTPAGDTYTYSPNDCSIGDVDGDGEMEIFVKWDPSNSHDNSENGYTGNVFIDCYKMDGTQLWRIDMGRNIRAGAHYTQFMVYDFDGDGKAEMIVKTAPGTIDGTGKAVLMGDDKVTDDYRGTSGSHTTGVIKDGPEYLTVFEGLTGAEINTIAYNPPRTIHDQKKSYPGWGDEYANRSERYLAGVAFLDGEHPSAVMCRGYYTHSYLWAVDFDGSKLTERWLHASTESGKGAYGEGAHSLTIGDVDGDGKDEIVYGAACIDHDGSLLYRTGGGHGDALHLGDFDPDREGLEIFMVHEEKSSAYPYDSEFRDAKTGAIIWCTKQTGNDIGRGLVGDISDTWRGYEVWPGSYFENGTNVKATFDCRGNLLVNKNASTCFRVYWDGDLLDELFDGKYDKNALKSNPVVEKRSANLNSGSTLVNFNKWNAQSCNTTKATPCLSADFLGDWREEIVLWDGDNSSDLLIFTTTIPSNYRVPCLLTDHNYRMAIAWQNTAYNQPPHLGYYLPDAFNTAPRITFDASANLGQSVEVGTAILPLIGKWVNCDGVEAAGLPKGVTLTTDAATSTFTIEGTPEEKGVFDCKLTTIGGEGSPSIAEFKLTVIEPVKLDRILYYTMDAIESATVANAAGTDAVVSGAPAVEPGIIANALHFNGGRDRLIQDPYDAFKFGTDDFSIEFLFNSTSTASYLFHIGTISRDDRFDRTGNWIGLELKGGSLKFAIDDDVNKSEASCAGSDYFDGSWHHVVLVREGATKTLKIYLDGALMAESSDVTGAVNLSPTEQMCVGNVNVNFDNAFKGLIDEFTIYRGAMPAATVASHYAGYGLTAITDITSDDADLNAPRILTLVEATTGRVVARGIGDASNVTSGVAPGVYLLVTRQGKTTYVDKVVL